MKFTAQFRNRVGRLVFLRTVRYDTEEGAMAACREFLSQHADLASFTLWAGSRKVTEENRQKQTRSRAKSPAHGGLNNSPREHRALHGKFYGEGRFGELQDRLVTPER